MGQKPMDRLTGRLDVRRVNSSIGRASDSQSGCCQFKSGFMPHAKTLSVLRKQKSPRLPSFDASAEHGKGVLLRPARSQGFDREAEETEVWPPQPDAEGRHAQDVAQTRHCAPAMDIKGGSGGIPGRPGGHEAKDLTHRVRTVTKDLPLKPLVSGLVSLPIRPAGRFTLG